VQPKEFLKDEKVVIPHNLRKEILDKVHTAHIGIVKSKKREKDILFWPGMGKDIENLITNCATCLQYQTSNMKETMMSA